jgi:glycerol-3-phosphate acyltransferase PlsY
MKALAHALTACLIAFTIFWLDSYISGSALTNWSVYEIATLTILLLVLTIANAILDRVDSICAVTAAISEVVIIMGEEAIKEQNEGAEK